jgi:deoxyribonuclease-1
MFKLRLFVSLLFLILLTQSTFASSKARRQIREMTTQGHKPLSYTTARKFMFLNMHLRQDKKGYFIRDVYCNQIIRDVTTRNIPKNKVMNCEHTWPRSKFNTNLSFSIQEADLHHLYPTNSRANSIRGNNHFTDFRYAKPIKNCETSAYGESTITGKKSFEPPLFQKGNVARALFYFAVRYNMRIPADEEANLRRWHNLDPVDSNEMRRNNLAQQAQGNRNPFIDNPALERQISDF